TSKITPILWNESIVSNMFVQTQQILQILRTNGSNLATEDSNPLVKYSIPSLAIAVATNRAVSSIAAFGPSDFDSDELRQTPGDKSFAPGDTSFAIRFAPTSFKQFGQLCSINLALTVPLELTKRISSNTWNNSWIYELQAG
ncbi:hypothetical protein K0M31_011929, partial [Melipona bicolor]